MSTESMGNLAQKDPRETQVLMVQRVTVGSREILVRTVDQAPFVVLQVSLARKVTKVTGASLVQSVCKDLVVPRGRMVPTASQVLQVMLARKVIKALLVLVAPLATSVLVVPKVMVEILAHLACLVLLATVALKVSLAMSGLLARLVSVALLAPRVTPEQSVPLVAWD